MSAVNLPVESGLVLPFGSLGLLGSGPEGRHLLAQFGIESRDLPADVDALRQRMMREPSLELAVPLVDALVEAAATAVAWASIRTTLPEVAPLVVVLGSGGAVAACLHGEVVEWMQGDASLPVPLAQAAARAAAGGEVLVSLFARGRALSGLRLHGDEVDVAARDQDALDRLRLVAPQGLPVLWAAMLAEIGADAPTR